MYILLHFFFSLSFPSLCMYPFIAFPPPSPLLLSLFSLKIFSQIEKLKVSSESSTTNLRGCSATGITNVARLECSISLHRVLTSGWKWKRGRSNWHSRRVWNQSGTGDGDASTTSTLKSWPGHTHTYTYNSLFTHNRSSIYIWSRPINARLLLHLAW